MVKETSVPLVICTGSGSSVCQSRNGLVAAAKQVGVEYMFWIDSDISYPPFALNRELELMESRGLDIIGATYLFKTPPHKPMYEPLTENQELTGIDNVKRIPMGLTLTRMKVFKTLEPPYFILNKETSSAGFETVGTEDYQFCDRLREAGTEIWMDTDLSFGVVHWGSPFGFRMIASNPGYEYMLAPPSYSYSES